MEDLAIQRLEPCRGMVQLGPRLGASLHAVGSANPAKLEGVLAAWFHCLPSSVLGAPSNSGLEAAGRELMGRSSPMTRRSGEKGEGVGTPTPVVCLAPPLPGLPALLPPADPALPVPLAPSAFRLPSCGGSAVDSKGLGRTAAPAGAFSSSARGVLEADEGAELLSSGTSGTKGRWCSGWPWWCLGPLPCRGGKICRLAGLGLSLCCAVELMAVCPM